MKRSRLAWGLLALAAALFATGVVAACSTHRSAAPEKVAVTQSALGTFNVLARCYGNSASHSCGGSSSVCVYDNECANTQETIIDQAHVANGSYTRPRMTVNDRIFAQPLYASSVPVGGTYCNPSCNVVFVATMQNTLYAFNADTRHSSTGFSSIRRNPCRDPTTSAQVAVATRQSTRGRARVTSGLRAPP